MMECLQCDRFSDKSSLSDAQGASDKAIVLVSAPFSTNSFTRAPWPLIDAAWSAFPYCPPCALHLLPSLSAALQWPYGLSLMLPGVHFHAFLLVHLHLPLSLSAALQWPHGLPDAT